MTKIDLGHPVTRRNDHQRKKSTYDLPPALCQSIRDIAVQLGCSQSDVVVHLLASGLTAYTSGQLDLLRFRQPAKFCLRFSHKLLPPILPGASNGDKPDPDRTFTTEAVQRNNQHLKARHLNSLPTPASHSGTDISPTNIRAVASEAFLTHLPFRQP